MYHYNLHIFEGCCYYSTNCDGAITILHLFEAYHYVRPTPAETHLQVYWSEERGRNVFYALVFTLEVAMGTRNPST
jgi:hypothetical protein